MSKKNILILLLLFVCLLCHGETKPTNEAKTYHFSAHALAGLNNYDMWVLGVGIEYAPIRYIGVSANFQVTDEFNTGWRISGQSGNMSWGSSSALNTIAYFMPEIDFHAPLIRIGRNSKKHLSDDGILITLSPGISIPAAYRKTVCVKYIPYVGNGMQNTGGGNYIIDDVEEKYYDLQGEVKSCFFAGFSVDYQLDAIRFGFNMTFSGNDPYSMSRGTVIEGKTISVPENKQCYLTYGIRFLYSFASFTPKKQ